MKQQITHLLLTCFLLTSISQTLCAQEGPGPTQRELAKLNADFLNLLSDSLGVQGGQRYFKVYPGGTKDTWLISLELNAVPKKDVEDKCQAMASALFFVGMIYRNIVLKHPFVKKLRLFGHIEGAPGKLYEEIYLFLPGGDIVYSCEANGDFKMISAYKIPPHDFH